MNDTKKILKNWNRFWTGLAMCLSLVVVMIGVNYNCFGSDDTGFGSIHIDTEKDKFGYGTIGIRMYTTSRGNIYAELFFGWIAFIIIQFAHIPIWNMRDKLIE